MVGYPVTGSARSLTNIVLVLAALSRLFCTTQPVQHIAGCTCDGRCYWPSFSCHSRCVAGHIVRTGATHYTEGTASETTVEPRSVTAAGGGRCRHLCPDQEILQILTSGVGDHGGLREHPLIPGIPREHRPVLVEDLAYCWKSWIVGDRKARSFGVNPLDLE